MKYIRALISWLAGCGSCRYGRLHAELAIERVMRKKAEEEAEKWKTEARLLRLELYGVPDGIPTERRVDDGR